MGKVCVYVKAGGNKVFFANGVLKVFNKHNFPIDHIIGFSASSAIIFSYLFNCEDYIVEKFAERLKCNKKNFYLCAKEHFPHRSIYKNSVTEMFDNFKIKNLNTSFTIITAKSRLKFKKIKASFSSILLGVRKYLGDNASAMANHFFGISAAYFSSDGNYSNDQWVRFILGSSTIYPFLGLNEFEGSLLLDGALANANYMDLMEGYDKKIIIHTAEGKTGIYDGILHIYSSEKIPNNIVDYTDDRDVWNNQALGEAEAEKNLSLIKKYIY